MSIIKILRESYNLDQKTLAENTSLSIEEIEKSESSLESVSKKAISSLSYYFGISSEELIFKSKYSDYPLISTSYHVYGFKLLTDNWWGHVGIRLINHKYSTWYPITFETANYLSNNIVNTTEHDSWITIETLNNKFLVFNPSSIGRLWILDDNADQIGDDWEIS